jgi:hypothetical protein
VNPNDVTGCRGLAGEVWFHKSIRDRSTKLPYPKDGNDGAIAAYASSLGMTAEEAKRLNVKSQALLGTIVEVRGEPWGVPGQLHVNRTWAG